MTTLVTGATGFLGSHVARQLVTTGHSVRVLVRSTSNLQALDGLNAERVVGDLQDMMSLDRAMKGVRRVFHVAADYRLWTRNPSEIYATNVEGTRRLLEVAGQAGVERVVYTSTVATIAVSDDPSALPSEETHATLSQMIGHYKRSKFQAELEAIKAAAARAHLTEYKLQFLEPELSWAQTLALQVKVRAVQVLASTGLADLTGLASLGGLAPLVQSTPMARELVRLSHFNRSVRLYAYCFCTAQ